MQYGFETNLAYATGLQYNAVDAGNGSSFGVSTPVLPSYASLAHASLACAAGLQSNAVGAGNGSSFGVSTPILQSYASLANAQ